MTEELENTKKQLEIEKLKIEITKIQTEFNDLNKPWFKKPQWWSVLVPFIIGAGTISIAFLTGIISVERLKNEKEDLAKTINLQKDSISYFSKSFLIQKDSLIRRVKLEQINLSKLQKSKDSLRIANLNQVKIIALSNKKELNRIDQEIYMYEDHDGIYNRLDEVLHDTTSKYERREKINTLRKARKAILLNLKSSAK